MAALFTRCGFDLISDDVLVHRAHRDSIAVLPSDCSARLWRDSAAALRLVNGGGRPATDSVKQTVSIPVAEMTDVHRLQAIFVLSWLYPASAKAEIRAVQAFRAFSGLRKNIYRDQLVAALDLEGQYMSKIATLVSAVPVFVLARSPDFSGIGDIPGQVADRVEV